MEFIVHAPDGAEYYRGDSRYRIGENNGVLTVTTEDSKHLVYGPTGWVRVEETEPRKEAVVL